MADVITVNGVMVPIGTHEGKTIIIGADHRGFEYKREIIRVLREKGYEVVDVGTCSPDRCDYPKTSDDIGRFVSKGYPDAVGIGICGSGIGIGILAPKHLHVYAARCSSPEEAEETRKHNNTNMLSIGADDMNLETALATVDAWLTTPFYSHPETEGNYLNRYVQTVELEERLGEFHNLKNVKVQA